MSDKMIWLPWQCRWGFEIVSKANEICIFQRWRRRESVDKCRARRRIGVLSLNGDQGIGGAPNLRLDFPEDRLRQISTVVASVKCLELPADAHFAWDVPSQGLNSLRKKSGPGNDRQGLNRLRKKSQPLKVRGEEPWYPTSRKKRARYEGPLLGRMKKKRTRG
jgi:hypothetical protein